MAEGPERHAVAADLVDSGGESHSIEPASRRRLSAQERRDQIIEAAIRLFGAHGYNGTTTRALAEQAGVSEATVFKHFPTKDALHLAAFTRRANQGADDLLEELERLAAERKDMAVLQTVVGGILQGLEQDRDMQRMLLFAWLEQTTEENERMSAQLMEYPLFPFLNRWVADRQAEGVFVDDARELIVAAVTALPVDYATRHKLYGLEANRPDDEVAATFAAFLLRGLRRPS